MNVIIAGSRGITLEPDVIADIVARSGFPITKLICGMASGIDRSAYRWALEAGIRVEKMPFMSGYGKAGGHIRNQKMVDIADAWIGIIEGGWTTGTKDCYAKAKKAKLPIYIENLGGMI